jgi:L-fucose isomerase-like protein
MLTRREFGSLSLTGLAGLAQSSPQGAWSGPAVVKTVFIAVAKPTWPNPQFDVERARREAAARLSEWEARHPGVLRLTGGDMVRTGDEAAAWARGLDRETVDGVVAVTLTSGSDGMVLAVAKGGVPTLLWNQPYLGHAWGSMAAWVRAGNRGDVLTSSDAGDLDIYARIFYAVHMLRTSKVAVVVPERARESHSSQAAEFTRRYGTSFEYLSYADLKAAWEAAPASEAEQEADRFVRSALRVVEPSREEIVRAVRFYLGVKKLLAERKANAITIDCLGGIQRRELPGYPCVAWSRLDDEGLYGVCQADLNCTMTQLLLTPLTGKPGFVFNSVFDSGRNELIQSHCTAPTAMQGIGGPRSPYIVRSHLETAEGVSLQVLMPESGVVTVAGFDGPQRLRISTAEVLGNVASELGCRTQIRTRVRDAERMMRGFDGGLGVHRVTFYGNYRDEAFRLARMLGFEIVEEA